MVVELSMLVPNLLIAFMLLSQLPALLFCQANGSTPVPPQSEWPEVKTAWCNPRADDDCYINSKKVPIAELGKWLPDISESNADQLGGHCETILCFDKDDQPMGYLLQ